MTPDKLTEEAAAMQQRTRELLSALEGADWFSTVGRPVPEPLRNEVISVSSWHEAVECCGSIPWEAYTLEQQNLLTSYLHNHARDRYRCWNQIVDEVKAVLIPIVEWKVGPVIIEHARSEVVGHCVRWDVLGACMESEYGDVRSSGFFTDLMGWYVQGRFPCGYGEVGRDGEIRLAEMEPDSKPDGLDPIIRTLNFPLLELPTTLPGGRLVIF